MPFWRRRRRLGRRRPALDWHTLQSDSHMCVSESESFRLSFLEEEWLVCTYLYLLAWPYWFMAQKCLFPCLTSSGCVDIHDCGIFHLFWLIWLVDPFLWCLNGRLFVLIGNRGPRYILVLWCHRRRASSRSRTRWKGKQSILGVYTHPWDGSENTPHRGKHHCMTDLLFDCFGVDQTSKTVVHLALAKQPNPSKLNRR